MAKLALMRCSIDVNDNLALRQLIVGIKYIKEYFLEEFSPKATINEIKDWIEQEHIFLFKVTGPPLENGNFEGDNIIEDMYGKENTRGISGNEAVMLIKKLTSGKNG